MQHREKINKILYLIMTMVAAHTGFADKTSCNSMIVEIGNLSEHTCNLNFPRNHVRHLQPKLVNRSSYPLIIPHNESRKFELSPSFQTFIRTSTPGIHTELTYNCGGSNINITIDYPGCGSLPKTAFNRPELQNPQLKLTLGNIVPSKLYTEKDTGQLHIQLLIRQDKP